MTPLSEYLKSPVTAPISDHYIGIGSKLIRQADCSNWILSGRPGSNGYTEITLVNTETGSQYGPTITVKIGAKISKDEMALILKSEAGLESFHLLLSEGRPKVSDCYPQPKTSGFIGIGTILYHRTMGTRWLVASVDESIYLLPIRTGISNRGIKDVKSITALTSDEVQKLLSAAGMPNLDDWLVDVPGYWSFCQDQLGKLKEFNNSEKV